MRVDGNHVRSIFGAVYRSYDVATPSPHRVLVRHSDITAEPNTTIHWEYTFLLAASVFLKLSTGPVVTSGFCGRFESRPTDQPNGLDCWGGYSADAWYRAVYAVSCCLERTSNTPITHRLPAERAQIPGHLTWNDAMQPSLSSPTLSSSPSAVVGLESSTPSPFSPPGSSITCVDEMEHVQRASLELARVVHAPPDGTAQMTGRTKIMRRIGWGSMYNPGKL